MYFPDWGCVHTLLTWYVYAAVTLSRCLAYRLASISITYTYVGLYSKPRQAYSRCHWLYSTPYDYLVHILYEPTEVYTVQKLLASANGAILASNTVAYALQPGLQGTQSIML